MARILSLSRKARAAFPSMRAMMRTYELMIMLRILL